MIRLALAAAVFCLAISAPIHAAAETAEAAAEAAKPAADTSFPSGPQLGEDLFKWGEYDSLIRVLEPATTAADMGARGGARTAADSAVRAKSYLFLGVAFFATGKQERADSAFGRACDLDPLVKLDRFYVTEEIANHFQAIALEGTRNRKPRNAVAMASQAIGARAAGLPVGIARRGKLAGSGGPGLRESRGKGWLWWGLGVSTALAAAGGGAYYISTQKENPPEEHVTIINAR